MIDLSMNLQQSVDMPADVTLQVVSQTLPDKLIGFFLTTEAIERQALHRKRFWKSGEMILWAT
jgi:hypothetical protein